ncbi:hypothetical protein K2173_004163 [Erythroxylum novogranatense]|uniref:TTF-type domain-containing protein n=1 Tax=Erythroxylum novogranatense TaxID=1862640 RepID=A0AAV8SXG8_9ROSI|nr:hypothetical protein K2173_004163 [Erythroxylum novogranatense]
MEKINFIEFVNIGSNYFFYFAVTKNYFKKLRPTLQSLSCDLNQNVNKAPPASKEVIIEELVIDLENPPSDPGLRPNIMENPPEKRDQVRRTYLLKGPCQPRNHNFPQTMDGDRKRRFIVSWFDDFKDWLEYSVEKADAYCLYCYLFSADRERKHTNFVSEGFSAWRKKARVREHVGNHDSDHNQCRIACENLMNQSQSIQSVFSRQSEKSKIEYRCRLNASIRCLRYLLIQGLPFRGNDESENSTNQGNFLELLKFIASNNEEIRNVVLGNAPENLKITSPDIQRDIINAAAFETTMAIILDMSDDLFSILVDECRDISVKEQMGVVIRYVDSFGCVIERFLGLVHVRDTSATSLLKGIKSLFSNYGLSITSLRGQGYDGASNMRGEFHGLKSLILKENSCAYYIHCFAHQLQLTLVAVPKKHLNVCSFFNTITRLCNVIGGSCKRRDMLREKQMEKVIVGISQGVIETGQELNQEMTLKRPGDTR